GSYRREKPPIPNFEIHNFFPPFTPNPVTHFVKRYCPPPHSPSLQNLPLLVQNQSPRLIPMKSTARATN
ncbi:hypothetical protein Tsubulata_017947, partial [Turnera subulata]